jgi:hypothetical protein
VIVIPPVGDSAILGGLLASLQARVEAVEASPPEPTVFLEPFDRLLQRRPLQARGSKLCRTAASDQSRVLEDLQMLGNRLNADREGLGEVTEFVSLDGVLEDPGGSEGFK